jgi:CBS domain-containing protein
VKRDVEPPSTGRSLPPLDEQRVVDVMRLGLISCPAEATVSEVARLMAGYRVHCVVVERSPADERPWAVISDLDLLRALKEGAGGPACELARTELVSVAADDSLERAVALMDEHAVSHLLVVQPHSGQPVGVLSALDLAGVAAFGGPLGR